jgi:hypothetical protein
MMYRNTSFLIRTGRDLMRTLLVHQSGLMYPEIFVRLEPPGVERVAAAARTGGHDVRLLDPQVFSPDDLVSELGDLSTRSCGGKARSAASFPHLARYPPAPDGASSICTKTVRGATVPMPRSPPAPTRADPGTGEIRRSSPWCGAGFPRRAPPPRSG